MDDSKDLLYRRLTDLIENPPPHVIPRPRVMRAWATGRSASEATLARAILDMAPTAGGKG